MSEAWRGFLIAFVIFEWVLRLFMLFIVPRNRRPSSATSWLLLIMILPTAGSIVFAMFGSPKLPKYRRRSRLEVDQLTEKEIKELKRTSPQIFEEPNDASILQASKLATVLGGLPPMRGNTVDFFTDYEQSLQVQADAINEAKEYVHLEYFIFVLDKDTAPLFDAIKKAVERGVKVRILYDEVISRLYPGYKAMKRMLNDIGVEWYPTLPLNLIPGKKFTRPDLRNHRKLLIIDGKTAFSGSQNIITKNYHRRDVLLYEEMLIKLSGPVVWQCNNVFRSDWFAETGEPLLGLVEDSDITTSSGSVLAQVLPSGPSHTHDNNLMLYTSLLHAAKKRISIVVPYFIPDESVMTAVISAAQRGVDVTIINSEIIDKVLAGHAQRSYYNELLEADIKIYLYKKPIFLHNKQVIIDDDVAVVGSSNLDIRSFELDLEVTFILYDKGVVRRLDKIENNYIKNSNLVTAKSRGSRPLKHKMLDSVARLTASLQ